jgi:hypothetical protein
MTLLNDPTIEADALNLARAVVNERSAIEVARLTARKCGVVNEKAFNELRTALAYAYAQGYVRGLRMGRARIVAPPPPPSVEGA